MKGQTYVILAILFVIVVAIFAVTNTSVVEVNYLFWSGEAPLILVILFSVLMGGIITASVGVIKIFRLQREIRSLKSENKQLNKTLHEHGLSKDEINEENEENATQNNTEP